jgi:hypothetical protein
LDENSLPLSNLPNRNNNVSKNEQKSPEQPQSSYWSFLNTIWQSISYYFQSTSTNEENNKSSQKP